MHAKEEHDKNKFFTWKFNFMIQGPETLDWKNNVRRFQEIFSPSKQFEAQCVNVNFLFISLCIVPNVMFLPSDCSKSFCFKDLWFSCLLCLFMILL